MLQPKRASHNLLQIIQKSKTTFGFNAGDIRPKWVGYLRVEVPKTFNRKQIALMEASARKQPFFKERFNRDFYFEIDYYVPKSNQEVPECKDKNFKYATVLAGSLDQEMTKMEKSISLIAKMFGKK